MEVENDLMALIGEVKKGSDSAFSTLCDKYKPLMVSSANKLLQDDTVRKYTDFDDLMQEASIALYKAALRYDTAQSKVTFGLYAGICIRNRLISIRRKLLSKARSENPSVAFGKGKKARRPRANRDVSVRSVDPGKLSEAARSVLSDFEKQVFALYVEQYSYREIAAALGKSEKAIDNALYRIKRKLKNSV